ncbi:YwmB family TATA-box binding protein [Peribacillus saganii]|uniref:YwmB family TATA-box binding protein n=1 Tax=Peribacillus saganii TaxID=2303992 RepID=UPI001313FB69|nr:YwmB family TATA-box binding protein [Peribacillus saganii]
MKKHTATFFTYMVFIGFAMFCIGNSTIVANNEIDILAMADNLKQDERLTLNKWSVIAREKTLIKSEQDFNKKVSDMSKLFPAFNWKVEQTEHGLKATAVLRHVEKSQQESIQILSALTKNGSASYIIYEVKGEKWDEGSTELISKTFQTRIKDIFHGNPSIFSCISGKMDGTMEKVFSHEVRKLLDLFHAQEVESLKEDRFYSVSAHTPMFRQYLTKENLNLQIALRTDGLSGKTTFVVGTPIIPFEY